MTLNRDDLELAGVRIAGTDTRLAGATDTITRDLAFGERVVIITEAIVTNVGLKSTSDGARVVRNLKAIDVFELTGDNGARVLNALRAERSAAVAEAGGELPLPGLDVNTTADLVVLTDRDLTGEDAAATAILDDLGNDLATKTETPPWAIYDEEPVGGVADYLDACREDLSTDAYRALLTHTLAYEEAHKRRRGVTEYVLAELTDVGPTPDLPDAGAELENLGLDDEVEIDTEDDLDAPTAGDLGLDTAAVIGELEADADAAVEIDDVDEEDEAGE